MEYIIPHQLEGARPGRGTRPALVRLCARPRGAALVAVDAIVLVTALLLACELGLERDAAARARVLALDGALAEHLVAGRRQYRTFDDQEVQDAARTAPD